MNNIISQLEELKEDKPFLILTNDLIKAYIEDNIEILIDEIKEELCI